MMSAVYAVVIAPAVQTVQVFQMEPIGQVTVDVLQQTTQVMTVMIVMANLMVIAG